MPNAPDITRVKTRVALLSVASNTVLVCLKLIVGALMGSVSVLSEAIHSGMDLVAAGIAYFSVRTSDRPADEDHPFGHGKYENVSGAVEALLIFTAAIWIIVEAVEKLITPREMGMPVAGMLVMGVSASLNQMVSMALFRVGKKTDSLALMADAWHLRTDVYTSVGVLLGLGVIAIGSHLLPRVNLLWVDPVVAILVALMILKAAYHLTVDSLRGLVDTRLAPEEEQWLREYLGRLAPMVRGIHGLRTRKAGAHRYVEFHMLVDGQMSVDQSHEITEKVEDDIEAHFPGGHVTTHVEPCSGECTDACARGCLAPEHRRNRIRAASPGSA